MNKTLLILFLLLASFTAQSQITFSPGVRAGVNFSSIINIENAESKTDFYIGAFAAIKFARFYTLQSEINYTRQGFNDDFGGIELNYLSFSVANKLYPVRDLGFHFIVGPAFNFKVSDNFEGIASDQLEDFDLVFFGGIGYDFNFGLSFEARYNIGIIDIFGNNINQDNFDNDFDLLLNEVFQIGASYKFDF